MTLNQTTDAKLAFARFQNLSNDIKTFSDIPHDRATTNLTKNNHLASIAREATNPHVFAIANDPTLRFVCVTPEGRLSIIHSLVAHTLTHDDTVAFVGITGDAIGSTQFAAFTHGDLFQTMITVTSHNDANTHGFQKLNMPPSNIPDPATTTADKPTTLTDQQFDLQTKHPNNATLVAIPKLFPFVATENPST